MVPPPDSPEPLTYGSDFHAVFPSPIFNFFVSISKPGSPTLKVGLALVQFAAVSLRNIIFTFVVVVAILYQPPYSTFIV